MYESLQYAIVEEIKVDTSGCFARVLLVPDRVEETIQITGPYAGPHYGFYCPVDVDDLVLVGAPSGDPNHGLVLISRIWSESDPPPQEAIDHPQDVVLHVRKDQNLRLLASGHGNAIIGVDNSGQLYLGQEGATDAAILGTTYRNAESTYDGALNDALTTFIGIPAAVDLATAVTALNGVVTFMKAWKSALSTFEGGASTFLSQNVKIGKGQ